jgi:HEXXH motif-containing protein
MPVAASLQGARDILEDVWPEVNAWVTQVVPAFVDAGTPAPNRHISWSIGPGRPIFVGRVGDPWTHAEDVVHELQHARLALFPASEAAENWGDLTAQFVSPYRDDPRPLRGLLLGLHAFVAVNRLNLMALHRRMRPLTKTLAWALANNHTANVFSVTTLRKHLRLTAAGRLLFEALTKELDQQAVEIGALAPEAQRRECVGELTRHISRVQHTAPRHLLNGAWQASWEAVVPCDA